MAPNQFWPRKMHGKRIFCRYSYQMRAVRPHPKSGQPIWTNQASICHGSYYFAIPGNLVKVRSRQVGVSHLWQDPRLGPTHTLHTDGRELSQDTLNIIRGVQWQVWHTLTNLLSTQHIVQVCRAHHCTVLKCFCKGKTLKKQTDYLGNSAVGV